ncbi:ABC transporter, permease protein [Methanosarcina sp. MTP4]|uniref:ABC transporter permease n=1 Tax=Methanosarcina sp. MTP4 TaxID=1434100 RepID=UPI000615EEA7|nr:ABC transporter permease [Methanosarcina sp. MTP4]AKB23884.1 ABC transporter, permease protein [Methanosarcina sp. MTP4]
MLNFRQAIKISLGSVGSAKLRSGLTTLGIIIGIAAVVANVSLGGSFNLFFKEEINALGSNFIIVFSQEPNLFYTDELEIIDKTPGVMGVSPIKQQLGEVTYLSQNKNINIVGVSEDYEETANIIMEEGSFITDQDKFSAVIGSDVASEKFDRNISSRSSIDVAFRLKEGEFVTRTFKVKGIIESPDTSFAEGGIDRDVSIFVPVSTINEMLEEDDFGAFFIMSGSLEDVEEVSDEVDKRLARNFGVSSRDLDDEDAKPYTIFNQADVLEQVNQLSDSLAAFLVAVALISLLVGSIGIMNIMLVTVTERTREIGIMKALGYSSTDVLLLFIVEAMILSLLGGIMGLGVGLAGAYAVTNFLDLPFLYPHYILEIGLGVALIVGVAAGAYPANKAAKMNPVDALRYE